MYCKNCGKEITEDARFCSFCGFELYQIVSTQSEDDEAGTICPICNSIEVSIYNSNKQQLGTVCMMCDSDIINGKCPNCGEPTANYKDEHCENCGCCWNISSKKKKANLPSCYDEFASPIKPVVEIIDEKIKCPNCNSTNLTANKKGYSAGKAVAGTLLTGGIGLLGGFLGSDKIRITCLKCGHSWSAGY